MKSPAPGKPAIRDAASLFIVDYAGGEPKILVGRRAAGHIFMPGRTVFPGGRVDPADSQLARRFRLDPTAELRLTAATGSRFSPARAAALALAAIREAWEEAGIMIGRPGHLPAPPAGWQPFAEQGVTPAPELLTPVARAITPPGQPRRYDTRFFAVDSRHIAWRTADGKPPCDELESVGWMSMTELAKEPLAEITQLILSGLTKRMAEGTLFDAATPMILHRRRPAGFHSVPI